MSDLETNVDTGITPESTTETTTTTTTESTTSWKESLSEDLRNDASLQDINDISSLAKGYVSAQRLVGSSIRIPSEDAGQEQLNEFYSKLEKVPGIARLDGSDEAKQQLYNKLGRPAEAKDYNLQLPEGIAADETTLNGFKELAHKVGLSNEQAQNLVQYEAQRVAQYNNNMNQQRTHAEQVLKQQWGNDYDNRLSGAKAAAKVFLDQYPDQMTDLMQGPAGNNPALLSILSQLAESLQEKGNVQLSTTPKYGMTPDEARIKIDEIMANKSHPYHQAGDPGHRDAVDRVRRLFEACYPEG